MAASPGTALAYPELPEVRRGVDVSKLDAAWQDDLEPQLDAVAAALRGDTDAVSRVAPRERLRWFTLVNGLVSSDRALIDRLAALLRLVYFPRVVHERFVAPISALAGGAQFESGSDVPVSEASVTSAERRVAIVQHVAQELRWLRPWLHWVKIAFSYLDTTLQHVAGSGNNVAHLTSLINERVYDGLYPLLRRVLLDAMSDRREQFLADQQIESSSNGGLSSSTTRQQRQQPHVDERDRAAMCVVQLAAGAEVRRSGAQTRRGLRAALAAHQSAAAQPWLRTLHGAVEEAPAPPTALAVHVLGPYLEVTVAQLLRWLRRTMIGAAGLTLRDRLVQIDAALTYEVSQLALLRDGAGGSSWHKAEAAVLEGLRREAMADVTDQAMVDVSGERNQTNNNTLDSSDQEPSSHKPANNKAESYGAEGASAIHSAVRASVIRGSHVTSCSDVIVRAVVHPYALAVLQESTRLETGGGGNGPSTAAPPSSSLSADDDDTGAALLHVLQSDDSATIERIGRLLGGAAGVADGPTALLPAAVTRDVERRFQRAALDAASLFASGGGSNSAAAEDTTATPAGGLSAAARRKKAGIAFVEALAEAWSVLSRLTQSSAVRGLPAVSRALTTAFAAQLGQATTGEALGGATGAELLPRYLDAAVRRAPEVQLTVNASTDDDLISALAPVAALVAIVPDKDAFVHVYRLLLADRLLSGRSTDLETLALNALRAHCPYLREAEMLLRDFLGAREMAAADDDAAAANANSSGEDSVLGAMRAIGFNATVVAHGRWPALSNAKLLPPAPILRAMQHIERRWLAKKRTLQWYVHGGRAVGAVSFASGTKEIAGGHAAISALYHLNDETITARELLTRLGHADGPLPTMVRQALLSLATIPKLVTVNGAPVESPAALAAALSAEDGKATIAIAGDLRTRTRKLELRAVAARDRAATSGSGGGSAAHRTPEEAAEARALLERRRMAVEATVTRVMKSRKELSARELTDEVQRVLAPVFACSSRLVRDAVTALVEREYLERDPEDHSVLRYLA